MAGAGKNRVNIGVQLTWVEVEDLREYVVKLTLARKIKFSMSNILREALHEWEKTHAKEIT